MNQKEIEWQFFFTQILKEESINQTVLIKRQTQHLSPCDKTYQIVTELNSSDGSNSENL